MVIQDRKGDLFQKKKSDHCKCVNRYMNFCLVDT
jgi:hypothetical protein